MGARQSRRSVDITTTPKKEGIPAEGSVVSEGGEKIEKLGMIEEADAKPTSNGVAPHTDSAEDKDKDKDEATEKDQDKEKQPEEPVAAAKEEAKPGESSAEEAPVAEVTAEAAPAEVTTPTEAPATPSTPNSTATTPDTKEAKKKDKSKKKWSFRSISFSRKDKSKPVREATPKNGDVAKEEPLAEGGEEAEAAAATTTMAATPEDKSAVSSPTEESKEESKDEKTPSTEVVAVAPAPAEELPAKKEEPSVPAPVETAAATAAAAAAVAPAALAESKVEVSPGATSQPIATPATDISSTGISASASTTSTSITETKTTEDTSLLRPSAPSSGAVAPAAAAAATTITNTTTTTTLPSSPPPTPIDPSPLQRAQQVAPSATALAEALKLPHETQQRQDQDDLALRQTLDPRLAQEVVELEESLQRSLDSQLAAEPQEEDVPPPLPVSPAPAEASRIASFAATTMQESVAVILDNAVTTTLPEEALKPKPEGSLDQLPPPSPPAATPAQQPLEDDQTAQEFPLPPQLEEITRLGNGLNHSPELHHENELHQVEEVARTEPGHVQEQVQEEHGKEEEKLEGKVEEKVEKKVKEEKKEELNLQNVPEPEPAAPVVVENNLSAKNEIVPTENGVADEAPKSPPPAVPVETPQPAPAITEDVASVTKAIEEIDISEKAVAAAVNENIESAGANEIVADSIHQNNLNE